MNTRLIYNFALVCLLFVFSCASEPDQNINTPEIELPEHIKALDNVTVHSFNIQELDTVELIKEVEFKSSDEVFFKGYLLNSAIDDNGRIYIADGDQNELDIRVFNPDGTYVTSFSRSGRGPGEFEAIISIEAHGNKLYALDARLQKFAIFSLDDFSLVGEETIRTSQMQYDGKRISTLRGKKIVLNDDGKMLMHFNGYLGKDTPLISTYYPISQNGMVDSNKVVELDPYFLFLKTPRPGNDGYMMPFTLPFMPHSLITFSSTGDIYTAWSSDFLIKRLDKNGIYKSAIYYNLSKAEVVLKDIDLSRSQRKIVSGQLDKVPKKWPILYDMFTDDESRLWVATIYDSSSKLKWWILDQKGEAIATFTMPGNRGDDAEFLWIRPFMKVKDGYLYLRENDSKYVGKIVKYKIDMKPRRNETSASN